MKMQRDGGAVIGQPASDKQAAIGCLTFLIAAVIVVYFLFFPTHVRRISSRRIKKAAF